MDQKGALSRADFLAKSSASALRRLNRRVESLQQDLLPVHELTKTLNTAHRNIGLAMSDLSEACSQLQAVVALERMLEDEQMQRDWERFFPCLEQYRASLAFVRQHPTLRQQRDLVGAVEEVGALALACLRSQFIDKAGDIPSGGVRWGGLEAASRDLAQLRVAITVVGGDEAPALLQDLRTEVVTSALQGYQWMMNSSADADGGGERDMSTHGLASVPGRLLRLLAFERCVFVAVLPPPPTVTPTVGSQQGLKKESSDAGEGTSAQARETFARLCVSVVREFEGLVSGALDEVEEHVERGGGRWAGPEGSNAGSPIGRRFDTSMSLLGLHAGLKEAVPPLLTEIDAGVSAESDTANWAYHECKMVLQAMGPSVARCVVPPAQYVFVFASICRRVRV